MEEWKYIQGTNNKYMISNLGNIKSFYYRNSKKQKILSCYGKNYKMVKLTKDNKRKDYYVHRLVAQTFIPNPNNYPIINHIDEDKSNNYYKNLEWCTYKYNNTYNNKLKNIKKPVIQYDLDFNFIKRWESISEVENELFIYSNNIIACCKLRNKSAGGYIWRYE